LGAKALGWQSTKTQKIRFDILTNFIKSDISNSSLVDAGCGFGDYYFYLEQNNLSPKSYIGMDLENFMCKIAQKRTSQKIYQKNIIKDKLIDADYYVCSGAMSLLDTKEYQKFITNILKYTKKAFVFNVITSKNNNSKSNSPLYFRSQKEIINFCQDFDVDIEICDKYLDNDFTVLLRK
jgi:SAM-dependent methyltransferase